jgi:hypothetical protein
VEIKEKKSLAVRKTPPLLKKSGEWRF